MFGIHYCWSLETKLFVQYYFFGKLVNCGLIQMWVVNDSQGCEMQMFHIVLSLLTDESLASKVLFVLHQSWHSKILRSCHKSHHLLVFFSTGPQVSFGIYFVATSRNSLSLVSSTCTFFFFWILSLAGHGTGAFSKLLIEDGDTCARVSFLIKL